MAKYRRRMYRRRRPMRKRMMRRKGAKLARITRKRDFHLFKRSVELPSIDIQGGGAGGALSFSLGDVPNVAEFQGLFDMYKITGVKLRFRPEYNTFQAPLPDETAGPNPVFQAGNTTSIPQISMVVDYNDANVPLAVSTLEQYTNCMRRMGNKPWSLFLRPKPRVPVLGALGTTLGNAYMTMKRAPWLDTATSTGLTVPHYGVKYWCDAAVNPPTIWGQIRVYAVYYLAMKRVK